jgi:hypothetical protein
VNTTSISEVGLGESENNNMNRKRPSPSTEVLVDHLIAHLSAYRDDLLELSLREKILRLIEVQDVSSKLGVALGVEAGFSKTSARDRIRSYLEMHEGCVIEGDELAGISGISEYARRIRELRNIEGLPIIAGPATDPMSGLKLRPNQYVLRTSRLSINEET